MFLALRTVAFAFVVLFCGAKIYNIWKNEGEVEPLNREKTVWIMYEAVFGTPLTDGFWSGWRYKYDNIDNRWFNPPNSLPTVQYPDLGAYSCHDPDVIEHHLSLMELMGIDGILVDWYALNRTHNIVREETNFTDKTLELLLEAARYKKVKIGVEIAQSTTRDTETVKQDISYFFEKYENHPSLLKYNGKPVIFINDARGVTNISEILSDLRSSNRDAFFVGGYMLMPEIGKLCEDGFDAICTGVPADNYRWSSNTELWPNVRSVVEKRFMEFVPMISPGYNDSGTWRWGDRRIRRSRESGKYYKRMWKSAIEANPKIVLINSFNDWYRGTQIEPSVPRDGYEHTEQTWTDKPEDNMYYIKKTRKYIQNFKNE